MNRYFIFLIMLVLAAQTNAAAQTSTLQNETNTQIPDSCKPVVPKDTVFFPVTYTDDKVFVTVEEMPQFPGGDKALIDFVKANTVYPSTAVKDSVYGRVAVRFVVGKGGCTARIGIVRGIREDLDNESMRVIAMMPKFKPGTTIFQSPKGWYRAPADVWYLVAFNYRLKSDPAAKGIEILPK